MNIYGVKAERGARVEDFLNDKLQTSADLATIDDLLDGVKKQQVLLEQQLTAAKATHKSAHGQFERHTQTLEERISGFRKQQADINRRLAILTQSETSDDAVEAFKPTMESLQRLDVAEAYIQLLSEVERLSSLARANFSKSPQDALQPYLRLQETANALKKAQPAAEDAAPHLVDHVDLTCRQLWKQMKAAFGRDFAATLERMKWPGKDFSLAGGLEAEWSSGVKKLLELQNPELKARDDTESSPDQDPLVLLPLGVMVEPLELRFKYHFEGDRPTNKLDKPEYFLSHIVDLLNTYDEFFSTYLQPILQETFRKSNLALTTIYIDSTSALITALLPMVRHKVFAVLPQIGNNPQLLSHLMHEVMLFDSTLRDEWSYDGGDTMYGWKGLTWEVLVRKSWFPRWLSVEKDFALARYHKIVEAPESFEIDYDSVENTATKPTYAAIRVNDLLETITDRYRPLMAFSQKIQFLIDIQIAIFDQFHNRLRDSLSAYLTLTSSIGRNLQGASKETQAELRGIGGLERLCRVYGSAEYLEKKMEDWSDDVFFIELWDELQDRARRNTGANNLAGPMSVEHVAERTSSAVGSDADTGGLFDETAGAFRKLRLRTEDVLQDRLIFTVRETLRPYGRINPWSSLSSPGVGTSLALTAELDGTIQFLGENLSFLAKVLAQAPLRRIVRQLVLAIQTFLWDSVLMRYTFSVSGITQFTRDTEAMWDTIGRWMGNRHGEVGMRRLKEALVLLNLPEKGGDDSSAAGNSTGPGLWEVEKRVFRDNESAREVLEELDLQVLSESDARNVLERRIDLGN